jgi:quercetin dioxygenase-like cupin family protein
MNDTQFPKLERQRVLESKLPSANPPVHVVKGVRIRFAPRQPTGRHRHPMSTCGVITCGSFDFQLQGEECKRLKTGDVFFEPAGHTILQFDNASQSEPAEIVCFYLTDTADRPAIEMLEGRHG